MAEPIKPGWDFHCELVAQKVDQYILTAYATLMKQKQNPTVAMVLETARDLAEKNRRGPDDDVGRDAEYYLKSRW